MKKTQLFLCTCLSLCLVSLNSCKKVDELTTFDLAYSAKVTVPSKSVINLPFDLFTPDVTTNSESEFATKGTAKDYIDKINLTSLAMKITSPPPRKPACSLPVRLGGWPIETIRRPKSSALATGLLTTGKRR